MPVAGMRIVLCTAAACTLGAAWTSVAGQTALTLPAAVEVYAGPDANGPDRLVSNAVPFAPGVVSSASRVRVLDGGVEIASAARVLATWPGDGSIRSLLLQFEAPGPRTYTIEVGKARSVSDRPFVPVTWDVPTRVFTLPAAYVSASLIVWEQTPLGESGFPAWDRKQIDYYRRIATVGSASCVRDDHYYDAITTGYQLYARSGSLTHLITARRWALHHRRDQVHLTGPDAGFPRCPGGYLRNTRYTFPQGLAQDYFMFGDEEARRVSALIVDNFYMPHAAKWYYQAPNARGMWTEREAAFALNGILAHYELTGERAYLERVRERIHSLRQMQVDNGYRAWVHNLHDHDPSEGCAPGDYGSSPWMTGLLLESIIKYHKLTGDPAARESILMAVDDLRARHVATGSLAGVSLVYLLCEAHKDGKPDLDNLIAHAFGYAYRLTGNDAYRAFGTTLFNTAVEHGVTSSHKHYNQQFRNSGHFPAYVAGRAPASTTLAAPSAHPGSGR